ncbi:MULTISPECIES: NAD(P)-dependent methylenetetrahydromethanopterin dehydrogenase [Thauera]|uniref:Methylenetetrahydromethanopterin dehydrogenase n=1 Tax=Thauera humireducens TaxID=1134435 RepID=A0A127K2Y3_9RHOO|nr:MULTISPECIES: NAD(P)-dependent methylenetetrahydromethanopterin dehydrogenase [Thauera]AMO36315.1 methylenetetrahydromethanopterin dehydrogenase [Thauera humireducens]ENO80183.1 methylene tetrahydromethanopterin dehydrogenase/methylenetetrahydrofolate dehydrogenase [Thauera sp. 63]
MDQRPFILHMFTPGKQMSPFDINMAVDAGYNVVVPYCGVTAGEITGLTQDAIFSRGSKGVRATGIFIGGRDVMLAADMLDTARKAMVPPFEVSVIADPSGSYTTAAALVACVEEQLRKAHDTDFAGKRVLILGGTGTVGRIAGVLAAALGAEVTLASHRDGAAAEQSAADTGLRFGCTLNGAGLADAAMRAAALAQADVVLATAAAGVQVVSADERAGAGRLLVAADVNAVPPEGIAGVGVMDDGKPLPEGKGVGIGALAVGNVKYQVEHRLLVAMRNADKPLYLGFREAFDKAREIITEKRAKA